MACRRFLIVLCCLLFAGQAFPAHAARTGSMPCDHGSMQQGQSSDCNNDGATTGSCDAQCATGSCIAAAIPARPERVIAPPPSS